VTPTSDDDQFHICSFSSLKMIKRLAAPAKLHGSTCQRTVFILSVLLLVVMSLSFAKAPRAQDEMPFQPLTCGAPMSVGSVVVVRDAKGIIVGRIKGESQSKSVYYDKYGRRQGWVIFKNSNCEIRDKFGRITYRGTWR
jgi:hypothetical protein